MHFIQVEDIGEEDPHFDHRRRGRWIRHPGVDGVRPAQGGHQKNQPGNPDRRMGQATEDPEQAGNHTKPGKEMDDRRRL